MSGYHEHSYDPLAHEQPGKPLRPYNWVQWTGVAIEVVAVLAGLYYLAGKIGWVPEVDMSPAPFILLPVIGAGLINSRREPGTLVGREQLRRNRNILLATLIICAIIIGAALIIEGVS